MITNPPCPDCGLSTGPHSPKCPRFTAADIPPGFNAARAKRTLDWWEREWNRLERERLARRSGVRLEARPAYKRLLGDVF